MTFKKFFYNTILVSICIMSVIISFNIYMNEYGLFGDVKGKSIKIWYNERTSKYLLSYNYIPSNFEGMLIGPSISDNLDTKKISGFKIYNASINGGNISELKYIAENVLQRGHLKFITICLHPYITKNHGRKTSNINDHECWSSLGSKETLKFYFNKVMIISGLRYDTFNDYGYDNYNLIDEKPVVAKAELMKRSDNPLNKKKDDKIEFIDEIAYNELREIINLSREKNVKIFGFYYPSYIENYNEKSFKTYKEKIDKLFDEKDSIWNFNNDEHFEFRSDLSNYYDKAHLSWKGSNYLIREINNKLNVFYGQR